MLEKKDFNNLITYVLLLGLSILAILVIKPIIISIIYGILLGYVFYPVYKRVLSRTKNKNLAAFLVCVGLSILILVFASLILGSLLKQVIDFSTTLEKTDIINLIRETVPNFLSSSEGSTRMIDSMNSSLSDLFARLVSGLTNLILDIPAMMLQLFIIIFVFYFSLRDGKEAVEYLKSISPLKKEVQEKFFNHFRDITNSVLVGQVVIGAIQGIIAGIFYFIFGVPNALLLTVLTMLVGVIPIIGPWLVWVPVDIYLFAMGKTVSGVLLLIFGLVLINSIDTILRPLIVSRRTEINSGIVLIGMIGGLFAFGILGLIIGPLVLAYVLLVIEIYRKSTIGDDLIFKKVKTEPRRSLILKKIEESRKMFPPLPKSYQSSL